MYMQSVISDRNVSILKHNFAKDLVLSTEIKLLTREQQYMECGFLRKPLDLGLFRRALNNA